MDKDFCWAESPTRHRKGKAGAEGGGNHDYLSRGNRGNSFDISDSCIFSEHQAFISKESCEQNSLWEVTGGPGLGWGEVRKALALWTKFQGAPKNSVIQIKEVIFWCEGPLSLPACHTFALVAIVSGIVTQQSLVSHPRVISSREEPWPISLFPAADGGGSQLRVPKNSALPKPI